MEANFFNLLSQELDAVLCGLRIRKVHSPARDIFTFSLKSDKKLYFRPAKKDGLLFLSPVSVANPQNPTGQVMRLRKIFANKKIVRVESDWPNLKLFIRFFGLNTALCLDIRNGVFEEENPACAPVAWPDLELILSDPNIWEQYPQISPPVRKLLAGMDKSEAESFLARLIAGDFHRFHYTPGSLPLAWPQPGAAQYDSALEAANAYGEKTLFPLLKTIEEADRQLALKREHKRLKKVLKRLDKDMEKQRHRIDLATQAEALQAELYKLDNDISGEVTLNHPELGPIAVFLDPRYSPSQNLARMFNQVGKGKRGVTHIERRKNEITGQLTNLSAPLPSKGKVQDRQPNVLPKRYKGLAVTLFTSTDGFSLVRGKNAKTNSKLAFAASQFDYWFHVAHGPGSHVILRRDHPSQEIPESTLLQAATLAANKSYKSMDLKAEVHMALVKDVRKVKGLAAGTVIVDKIEKTITVKPDQDLEQSLSATPKP